jgi:membrane-associated phospholipid phosphatase
VDVRSRAAAFAFALGAAVLCTTGEARAADGESDPSLQWDESHPRFRPDEYAFTLGTGVFALWEYFFLPSSAKPRWTGGILFDDAVHDALRVTNPSALRTIWTVSDIVGSSEVVITVGLDSMLVPVARGSFDVAWQLTWFDLEAYALGSAVTFTLYDTVARARPAYSDCLANPASANSCTVSPTASFPSGHVAESFISAGLSCANHAYVPLYGSRLWDALACARDVTLATADGVLRIMGDRHWATDVIAGGGLGFAFGYAMPVLLHYTAGPTGARGAGFSLAPMGSDRIGVVANGVF